MQEIIRKYHSHKGTQIVEHNEQVYIHGNVLLSLKRIMEKTMVNHLQTSPNAVSQEQLQNELRRMRRETRNLQLSVQRYTASDLSNMRLEDFDQMEQQLECSINKVRTRKVNDAS